MNRRRLSTPLAIGSAPTPSAEGGFALLAVMLVLTLLGVVTAEFAYSMRIEASMVRAYRDRLLGVHLAEAGVEQAIREVLSDTQVQGLDPEGQLVFYRVAPGQTVAVRLPMLQRSHAPLGPGEFSYRISDEEARINVNAAAPERIDQLLTALEVEKETRDIINDSLQDWKDADDVHRANGAESDDYYLKLPVPYRARNAQLQDLAELLQIRGVTPELYWGTPDHPGLAEYTTVFGRNLVNLNTAPPAVLRALHFSEAEVTDVVQARASVPYLSVPGRFGGRGLSAGSQTFRIEAEGIVAGGPKARVIAIVQKRSTAAGFSRVVRLPGSAPTTGAAAAVQPAVSVLSWRTVEDR